jgi:acyl-CoA thioesterase
MFPKVTDGLLSAWIRALDAREMDYETLTAICDTGLPHIFVRLRRPVPVSTVTMNIFYHATAAELAQVGDDFLLSASRMRNAGHGFFDASTEMWSRAGALLATTEQVVWFKVPDVPNPSA